MLLVTLGDSLSCGEGVGLRVPLPDTWVGRLAASLPAARHLPLATPGARTADVRRVQLPQAVAAGPCLATVATGLNDVTRAGFALETTREDLLHVVQGLRQAGATVLLVRLHDPTLLLPLPGRLRRAVQQRVAAVNGVVDETRGAGVVVLDLATVPALAQRGAWAVDRMHPSVAGHVVIAQAAARALRRAGVPVGRVRGVVPQQLPGRPDELVWLARHGLPWLASHSRQVGGPLVAMTARGLGVATPVG